jgi:hypothetical protein
MWVACIDPSLHTGHDAVRRPQMARDIECGIRVERERARTVSSRVCWAAISGAAFRDPVGGFASSQRWVSGLTGQLLSAACWSGEPVTALRLSIVSKWRTSNDVNVGLFRIERQSSPFR